MIRGSFGGGEGGGLDPRGSVIHGPPTTPSALALLLCQCVPFFVPCYVQCKFLHFLVKNGKVSSPAVAKMGFYDGFEWIS